MKLPNGYGSVVKLSGKRRKPWMVRKTTGYRIDPVKEKKVNEYIIIGYAATKTEGLQMLADYNRNPYDTKAAKMTFDEVYEEWSKKKFPTVSESNIKGYKASYKTCGILYNRVFKDLKLADLQQVIDTCGKNFPTLKKIKILFNQLYEFALNRHNCVDKCCKNHTDNNTIHELTGDFVFPLCCPLFYPVQFSFMPEIHATLCVRHPVFVHLLPPLCG